MKTLFDHSRLLSSLGCVACTLAFSGESTAALLQVAGINAGPFGLIQVWVLPPPVPFGPTPPTDQFLPTGSTVPGANGRALAADQARIYYSHLSAGFGPSDGIHVVPVVPGTFGGPDSVVFPNPNPSAGIRDMDVSIVDNDLYVFTGSQSTGSTVYRLNRTNGQVISSVQLQSPSVWDADGFTVLPNGNFLLNLGDAVPIYQAFDPISGFAVGSAFSVPCDTATGVDAGLAELVFQCDFNSFLVTTLSGVVLEKYWVTSNQIEDIEGVFGPPIPMPSPSTLVLTTAALAALALCRNIRHR